MIQRLARITLPGALRDRLGLKHGRLALRRAWARSGERLLLEFLDGDGRIVPGQWMNDPAALERVARQTARNCPGRAAGPGAGAMTAVLESEHVLLQLGGADRRLVGLQALLARADATLLAHRPERRATVRLDDPASARFAKVVRPSQLREVTAAPRHLDGLPDRPFAMPRVIEIDEPNGVVTCSRLEGVCLHELLGSDEAFIAGAGAAGGALRGLHGCAPPPECAGHDAASEIAMLGKHLDRLRSLAPAVHAEFADAAQRVFAALAEGSCGSVLLHRDFYDRQVFIDTAGRTGLLDFDTMATGEPALDVANMLVHLQLRAMQQRCSPDTAEQAAAAFLEAYRPEAALQQRLPAYQDATRLRLACLYSWRPRWRHLGPDLVKSVQRNAGISM